MHKLFKHAISLLAIASMPAFATIQIDQVSKPGASSFNANSPYFTMQQQVLTGISGQLFNVSLYFKPQTGASLHPFAFFINKGKGWQSDANDFSSTVTPVAGWTTIDVSSANLNLSVGEGFVIGVRGLGLSDSCCTLIGAPNGYSKGALYTLFAGSPSPTVDNYYDLAFTTTVSTVPEPSTLLSLTLGLAVIGGYLRVASKRVH